MAPATDSPSRTEASSAESGTAKPLALGETQGRDVNIQDDYFYPEFHFVTKRVVGQMFPMRLRLVYAFGLDSLKRSNLLYVEDNMLITSIGNVLMLINLKTLDEDYMINLREGGIGAIAVHPSKHYVAVAEKHSDAPNIYIYEYPSLRLYRVLKKGTVRAYTDICFNAEGNRLASVGGHPDFTLTIWNWKQEKIILRNKAFSQDIYRVEFSPDNDGQLTTSGMAHIKFWKIASTFTGLKLQGQLGKFGATGISDISAFIHLPDGKVLSGTETGNMLLWEDGLIKCEIGVIGKKLCHQGPIDVVLLEEGEVITAGEDGFVRIWDFETIDNADIVDASQALPNAPQGANAPGPGVTNPPNVATTTIGGPKNLFEMEPLDEILIGKDVKIKTMEKCLGANSEYIIQDAFGNILKLDLKKRSPEKILAFHAGAITYCDTSHCCHYLASTGSDGTLRIHDYINKTTFGRIKYPHSGTCLSYLPKSLDPSGRTVAVGFSDGVVRIVHHGGFNDNSVTGTSFILTHLVKPHKSNITALAFSPSGTSFATSSEDNTVFFFHIDVPMYTGSNEDMNDNLIFDKSVKFVPLGFIQVNSPANTISWDPESSSEVTGSTEFSKLNLLVTLRNGEIMKFKVPQGGKALNIEGSYELKEKILEEEFWSLDFSSTQEKVDEKTEKKPATGEKTIPRIDTAPVPPSAIVGDLVEVESIIPPKEYLAVSAIYYSNEYIIYAATNSKGMGEIRTCQLSNNKKSRLLLLSQTPFSSVRLSESGSYILAGTVDGTSYLFAFNQDEHLPDKVIELHDQANEALLESVKDEDATDLDQMDTKATKEGIFWKGHIHDCDNGRINACITSFDDSYLISAGSDGGLFVWRVTFQQVKRGEEESGYMEDKKEQGIDRGIEDAVDEGSYTIQEARQKAEKDRELMAAEVKRQVTRDQIAELREVFLSIVHQNENAPPDLKIPKEYFEVDFGLDEEIAERTKNNIAQLRKELQWESEKETILLEKLRKHFLDAIETERIEVTAFKRNRSVTTFRTTKLPSHIESALRPLYCEQKKKQEDVKAKERIQSETSAKEAVDEGQKILPTTQNKKSGKRLDTRTKLEARKALRAERAAKLKELLDEKPGNDYEDPKDVAAIRYAETHMGDYKLKTDKNYIVPESERVDADKKRRQMALLTESLHTLKEKFNRSVLILRDQKQRLIEGIISQNGAIAEFNSQLQELGVIINDSVWCPQTDPSVYPENRYKVTMDDVAQLLKEEEEETVRKPSEDILGFAVPQAAGVPTQPSLQQTDKKPGGSAGDRLNYHKKQTQATQEILKKRPYLAGNSNPMSPPSMKDSSDDMNKGSFTPLDEKTSMHLIDESPTELREKKLKIRTLTYKKERIFKNINNSVNDFDCAVEAIESEKILLKRDIKFGEMKLLLLYKEWVLLKEFEKHDGILAEKLSGKQAEKADIDNKLRDCQDKLAAKKHEVELVGRHEKEIQEELKKILEENNKHEEFLSKTFKKKIKRVKKKAVQNVDDQGNPIEEDEASSSEEDDDDYDSTYDSEESGSLSEDERNKGCPPDLEEEVYKKVCKLREQRMDQEDVVAEIQKSIELLKKENDSLIKKEKIINQALANAETEIQEFHSLKQQKLNELDVVVPLRLHQIQWVENKALPSDLSPALVFVNEGLQKLKNRIKELQQEKADIRKNHKELRKMHVSLVKSKKEKQDRLSELEQRAYNVQMLKFGQVIDLEKLERMGVNKAADELRDKLQKEDMKRTKELEKYDSKINRLREELTQIVSENTHKLEDLVSMTEQQQRLEIALNSSQSHVTAEYSKPKREEVEEREKLLELVQLQAADIQGLQAEINSYTKKSFSTQNEAA